MNLFDTGYTEAFQVYERIYRQVNGLTISKSTVLAKAAGVDGQRGTGVLSKRD